MKKYLALNDPLYDYLCRCRTGADDPVLRDLRKVTEELGDGSRMLISQEQGTLLSILAAVIGARSILEVGTFTGYSSICLSRPLPRDGRLVCIDQSEEWTRIARDFWKRAGVADRIELRLGDAIPILESMSSGEQFDFAFIDAAKSEYDRYYELILPHVRANGLILFDNMLWDGRVIDENDNDPNTIGLRELNRKLASDDRVEAVLLPVADGLQLCRKK